MSEKERCDHRFESSPVRGIWKRHWRLRPIESESRANRKLFRAISPVLGDDRDKLRHSLGTNNAEYRAKP